MYVLILALKCVKRLCDVVSASQHTYVDVVGIAQFIHFMEEFGIV